MANALASQEMLKLLSGALGLGQGGAPGGWYQEVVNDGPIIDVMFDSMKKAAPGATALPAIPGLKALGAGASTVAAGTPIGAVAGLGAAALTPIAIQMIQALNEQKKQQGLATQAGDRVVGAEKLLEQALYQQAVKQANAAPPTPAVSTPATPPQRPPVVAPPMPQRPQTMNVSLPNLGAGMAEAAPMPRQAPAPQMPQPQMPQQGQMTPEIMRALGVAESVPQQQPMMNSGPSPNTYGYESILNQPQFSEEAMLGPSQPQTQAPAQQKPSFLGGLGQSLVGAIPSLLQGYAMHKMMNDNGGVKDWQTGLTFGARPMEQNPAYLAMINNMAMRQKEREQALKFQYDTMSNQQSLQNNLMLEQFKSSLGMTEDTAKSSRDLLNALMQNKSLDMNKVDPNDLALIYNSDPNDPEVYTALSRVRSAVKPEQAEWLREMGLKIMQSADSDPNILQSRGAQAILTLAGLAPKPDTIYGQEQANARAAQSLAGAWGRHYSSQAQSHQQFLTRLSLAQQNYEKTFDATQRQREIENAFRNEQIEIQKQRAAASGQNSGKAPTKLTQINMGGNLVSYGVPGADIMVQPVMWDGKTPDPRQTPKVMTWQEGVSQGLIVPLSVFGTGNTAGSFAPDTVESGEPDWFVTE